MFQLFFNVLTQFLNTSYGCFKDFLRTTGNSLLSVDPLEKQRVLSTLVGPI